MLILTLRASIIWFSGIGYMMSVNSTDTKEEWRGVGGSIIRFDLGFPLEYFKIVKLFSISPQNLHIKKNLNSET